MIEETVKYFFKIFARSRKYSYAGKTCAILSNFGNTSGVSDILVVTESKEAKRDLIALIIFEEYIELFELLLFKDEITFSIFQSSQVKNRRNYA